MSARVAAGDTPQSADREPPSTARTGVSFAASPRVLPSHQIRTQMLTQFSQILAKYCANFVFIYLRFCNGLSLPGLACLCGN